MSETPKRILVTAALPYANGPIHLGHLAGAYLPSDIYVRYHRRCRHNILFICGSDEHGVPITIRADKEGVTPKDVVDRFHGMNTEAFARFGMSFDNYSRTSAAVHHVTASEFFLDFHQQGILKKKDEQQLYCEKDRMFLADRYVEGICPVCKHDSARGDQCEQCGPWLNGVELISPRGKLCGSTPIVRTTTHFYLPLGDFQQRLEQYVHSHTEWKENVKQYCESWFREGLQDRAVTRDLNWGVPVPLEGYPNKVLYVWFDAVLGYISSTKEWAVNAGTPEKWKEYWQDEGTKYVAFIGKDNVVFHCIVFPAMLMAKGGYILPDNVPANEFLNLEGGKFSKSRNNAIYLKDVLESFDPDQLRYTLACNLPETRDTDFYWKDFQAKNNSELADIYGNFVNRTLAFTERNFEGKVPPRGVLNNRDKEIVEYLKSVPGTVGALYDRYKFRDGTAEVMNLARAANKYFNDSEPWKTVKSDRAQCATTLNIALQIVRSLSILFSPVVPFSSERIWKMMNIDMPFSDAVWDDAGQLLLPEGHQISKPEIVFRKIEDAEIERELAKLGPPVDAAVPAPGVPSAPIKPIVGFEDFQKIDLRVAKIIACEPVPKSKKLLRLQVEIGGEKRQIVAGIAQQRSPEELIGKSVIVVANLAPATLMGVESQGMLLATHGDGEAFALLTVSNDVPSGSWIK
ncbi:MAG: methionine--tRNA ligase [Ignavibacteriales bacterium]|nr:methionine--tRNA ligase [Ignavibacteriales bacterium]